MWGWGFLRTTQFGGIYLDLYLVYLWSDICLKISYQVHTWINPYCSVKLVDGEVDKAVAFSKVGLNLLNSEESINVSSNIKLIQFILFILAIMHQ